MTLPVDTTKKMQNVAVSKEAIAPYRRKAKETGRKMSWLVNHALEHFAKEGLGKIR